MITYCTNTEAKHRGSNKEYKSSQRSQQKSRVVIIAQQDPVLVEL